LPPANKTYLKRSRDHGLLGLHDIRAPRWGRKSVRQEPTERSAWLKSVNTNPTRGLSGISPPTKNALLRSPADTSRRLNAANIWQYWNRMQPCVAFERGSFPLSPTELKTLGSNKSKCLSVSFLELSCPRKKKKKSPNFKTK